MDKFCDRADRKAVVTIVVVRRIDIARIEVQVVGIAIRVQRRRPVVAIRTAIVQARVIDVASGGEENSTLKTPLWSCKDVLALSCTLRL